MRERIFVYGFVILLVLSISSAWGDPYIDSVVEFQIGDSQDASFSDSSKVLGPPCSFDDQGLGGSVDVYNLGIGGSITVEFTDNVIYDGPGIDFVVFENPFYIGGDFSRVYVEPAYVFVSSDGDNYTSFTADYMQQNPPLTAGDDNPDHYLNFAGIHPVFSNPENGCNPLNPLESGGDAFDLSDVREAALERGIDLQNIRFIRIQDVRRGIDVDKDGEIIPGTTNPLVNGFDLDAIAAIHNRVPHVVTRAGEVWSLYE